MHRPILLVALVVAMTLALMSPALGQREPEKPKRGITSDKYARYCTPKPLAPKPWHAYGADLVRYRIKIKCSRTVVFTHTFERVYTTASGRTVIKDAGAGAWDSAKRGVLQTVVDDGGACSSFPGPDEFDGEVPSTVALRVRLRTNPSGGNVTSEDIYSSKVLKRKLGPATSVESLCPEQAASWRAP